MMSEVPRSVDVYKRQVKALREALLGHGRSTRETVDADLGNLLAADNEAAAMSLVARPGLCTVEDLQRAGATPGRWARTAATLPLSLIHI